MDERLDLRFERPVLRPERLDLRPERLNLRPEGPDLRSQKPDLRPEGPDEGAGGGDGWTDGQTNKQMDEGKSPCVLQDFVPFGAAAQKLVEKGMWRRGEGAGECGYGNESGKGE